MSKALYDLTLELGRAILLVEAFSLPMEELKMKRSAARYEMDMTSGPILMKMVRFSIPLMFSTILQLLYNAADMVVVGRFAGSEALAAVGSTGAITSLLVNLFLGLSVGASVAVAQHYGANRYKDVSQSVHTTVALALFGGIVIGILGMVLARPLLVAMSTPEDVIDLAVIYMTIYFAGMPANLLYNFCAAILRAVGDTKRPLYYLTIAGIVNVVLNLIFVIVFHMSVAGVALATVVSQVVSMVLVGVCLIRTEGAIHLDLRRIRIYGDKAIQIVRVGLPAGLQSSMFSISNTLIQSSINAFGSAAIAGNTAASNIESFVNASVATFGQAAMSFTSQNYGAKKPERLWRIAWCGTLLTAVSGAVLGILVVALGKPLLGIFASEAAVIAWGLNRMRIMGWLGFIGNTGDVYVSGLRGTGNSLFPMLVSIMSICVFRVIWIYTAFDAVPTPEVLYMSYPISWTLATSVHFICFVVHMRRVARKLRAEIQSAEAVQY